MPGAKLSCNGFYMFMLEVKKREETRGKRFPRGLDDVNPIASMEWERMGPEAKTAYKEKAREYKSSQEFRAKKRQTRSRPLKTKTKVKHCNDDSSSDDSFSDDDNSIFYGIEDEDKFWRRREQDRNAMKTALTWNLGADSLAKKIAVEPFYILAVQNYYETPDHDYAPSEIAMVEFSLVRGITRQYNAILKPIHIPEHYRSNIGKKAMSTHKISPDCPPLTARNDYRGVVDETKNFYSWYKQSNQFRAFVLSKQFNSAQGAVKALRNVTGSKCFIPHEKVSCVEDLYALMCSFKHCDPKRLELSGFTDLLIETNWDYEPRTLCSFHNHVQSKYCALAIARKTCYYLFEHLKDIYCLNLTENHVPPMCTSAKYRNPNLQIQQQQRANERDMRSKLMVANFTPKEIAKPAAYHSPAPNTSSVPLSRHFSAFNAPFAPAFSKPSQETENAMRRPTTKSICSRMIEEKRNKSFSRAPSENM